MKYYYNVLLFLFASMASTSYGQTKSEALDHEKAPYILLSSDTVKLGFAKDFATVAVLANNSYTISNVPQWLTATKDTNNNLTLFTSYYSDYRTDRHAILMLNAPDNAYTRSLVVVQKANTEVEYEKVSFWSEDGLTRIARSQESDPEATKTIELFAARNETEMGQVVVYSDVYDFEIIGVDFTDLTSNEGTIGAEQLKFNYALYECAIPTNNQGHSGFAPNGSHLYPANEIPDPLSNDSYIAVPKQKNQPIYITVTVPRVAKAGQYAGLATVKTSYGNLEVPISLEVFSATIPDMAQSNFVNYNWMSDIAQGYYTEWNVFDTYYKIQDIKEDRSDFTEDFYEIVRAWGKQMKEHRQNAVLVHTVALLNAANSTVSESGEFTFDWTLFDKYIDNWLSAGMTKIMGIHYGYHEKDVMLQRNSAGKAEFVWKSYSTGISYNMERDTWYRQYLSALAAHIEAYDITKYPQFVDTDKANLFDIWHQQLYDEPTQQSLWVFYAQVTDTYLVNSKGKKVPVFDADMTGATLRAPYTNYADIQVPQLKFVPGNEAAYQSLQDAGVPFWLYVCVSPAKPWLNRFLSQPDTTYPLLFWYAAQVNATGYLHWALNVWNCGWFWDGDTYMTYPDVANKSIMSSIRFEGQLNGVEDWELAQLAKLTDAAKTQQILNLAVVHPNGDYVSKPSDYRALRYALLQLASGNAEVQLPDVAPGGKSTAPQPAYGAYYVDNLDHAITYNGMQAYHHDSEYESYQKSVHYQNYSGAVGSDGGWAQFDFNGTGIEVMSEQRSNKGLMRVELYKMVSGSPLLIDQVTTDKCYSNSVVPFYIAYKNTDLEQGDYRIRTTHVRKEISGSSNSQMVLDAFIVHTAQPDGSSLVARMTALTDDNGTVTISSNDKVVVSGNAILKGSSITVVVAPKSGYVAKGININGAPMDITNNRVTIDNVRMDMIIAPIFEKSN